MLFQQNCMPGAFPADRLYLQPHNHQKQPIYTQDFSQCLRTDTDGDRNLLSVSEFQTCIRDRVPNTYGLVTDSTQSSTVYSAGPFIDRIPTTRFRFCASAARHRHRSRFATCFTALKHSHEQRFVLGDTKPIPATVSTILSTAP